MAIIIKNNPPTKSTTTPNPTTFIITSTILNKLYQMMGRLIGIIKIICRWITRPIIIIIGVKSRREGSQLIVVKITDQKMGADTTTIIPRISSDPPHYWINCSYKGLSKTNNPLIWAITYLLEKETPKDPDKPWLIGLLSLWVLSSHLLIGSFKKIFRMRFKKNINN